MHSYEIRRIIREMVKKNIDTEKNIGRKLEDENIVFVFFVNKKREGGFCVAIKLYHKKRETSDDFEITEWVCTDSEEGIAKIIKEAKQYANILKRRFKNA